MTSKELFKSAITDALASKYEQELASCEVESFICSKKHYSSLKRITGLDITNGHCRHVISKRLVAAIIAAAVLLLTACVSIVHRKEIGGFIELVYDKGLFLILKDEPKDGTEFIEEIYEMKYVPEGFELTETDIKRFSVHYAYTDLNGQNIFFDQSIYEHSQLGMDNEQGESSIIEINGREIYYRHFSEGCVYVWVQEEYIISLGADIMLDREEFEKIYNNISVKGDE